MTPQAVKIVKGKGPYVQLLPKLEEPFYSNDLCRSWVIEWLSSNKYDKNALAVTACGSQAVSLACFNGHQKRVRTSCHREYCLRCGTKGSLEHKKRYLRALDRLMWSPVLGYMIFTLPREVSEAMPSKEQLSKIEKEAVSIVRDNFNAPGCMARIHFMGEEIEKLHIHVNVLFPIEGANGKGEVDLAVLKNVRQKWTSFINQTFNLSCKATNVFYKFKTSAVKMRHTIKYVTRPIVTAEKFLSLSNEAKHWYLALAGWHNTRWYGKLANHKYKEYLKEKGLDILAHREADIATSRKCPVCGEHYKYQGIIDIDEISRDQFRQVDKDVWVDRETFACLKDKSPP